MVNKVKNCLKGPCKSCFQMCLKVIRMRTDHSSEGSALLCWEATKDKALFCLVSVFFFLSITCG